MGAAAAAMGERVMRSRVGLQLRDGRRGRGSRAREREGGREGMAATEWQSSLLSPSPSSTSFYRIQQTWPPRPSRGHAHAASQAPSEPPCPRPAAPPRAALFHRPRPPRRTGVAGRSSRLTTSMSRTDGTGTSSQRVRRCSSSCEATSRVSTPARSLARCPRFLASAAARSDNSDEN